MKKVIAFILALTMALALTGCKSSDYKSAVKAMEDGDYAAAARQLETLDDYRDSRQLLKQCRYALAVENFNAGDYESALEIFKDLGDYIDAANYAVRAQDGLLRRHIAGGWHSDVLDVTDLFLAGAESQMEGITEGLKEHDLSLKITLNCTFAEDGTCSVAGAIDDLDGFLEKLNAFFRDLMEKTLESEFAAEGLTMDEVYAALEVTSMDELFQAVAGMTLQEFLDSIQIRELIETALEELKYEGTFTIEDGTILCNGDKLQYNAETDTLELLANEEGKELLGVDSLSMSRN